MEIKTVTTRPRSQISGNFFTIENVKNAFPHKDLEATEKNELKRIPSSLARQAIKDRDKFIIFPFIPRLLPREFLKQYNQTQVNRWVMLRRMPIDQSFGKVWPEQAKLIPENEKLPEALVIAYAMILMTNRSLEFLRLIGWLSFRSQTICSKKERRVAVGYKMYKLAPHLFTFDDTKTKPNLGILTEKVF